MHGSNPKSANDDQIETELEAALRACPGPRSADPWWSRHRHHVLMRFGAMTDGDGEVLWPAAAEYARHQEDFERAFSC